MIIGNSLLLKQAAADSTPADPVTRSLRFDPSSNSYLQRATGSTDTTWTMAMWVKRSGLTGYQYLFNFGSSKGLAFYSGTNSLYYYNGSTNTSTEVFRDPSAWFHLTMVTTSGTATFYVNGVQVTSNSFSTPRTSSALGTVTFGRWTTGAYDFDGYLADIHFIEGEAKSPTDFIESNNYGGYIPKEYTGSFGNNGFHIDAQPAHDADLLVTSVGRNDGDTTFVDVAAGHTITKTGTPQHKNTVGNPFDSSGTAMYFSGSSDSVKTTASSDFAFGTGDFTMEGWWYFNTISSSSDAIIVDLRPANDSTTTAFSWSTNTNNGLKIYRNGSSALGGSLSTETWHHLALVRSSGTVTVYIDGVPSATTLDWSSVDLTTNGTPRLGAAEGGGSVNLDGYVFDVRITKGTARYTSNFSSSLQSAPFELNPVYIGGDQSGNKNHFQPTGISSHDAMRDTPTSNFCTFSPISGPPRATTTISEGNLKVVGGYSSYFPRVMGTVAVSSGKWFYEVRCGSTHTNSREYGFKGVNTHWPTGAYGLGGGSTSWATESEFSFSAYHGGVKFSNSSTPATSGTTWGSDGDVIGLALDLDSTSGTRVGTLRVFKNGSEVGSATDIPTGGSTEWLPCIDETSTATQTSVANFGQDPTFGGLESGTTYTSDNTTGVVGEFHNPIPSGYLPFAAGNLTAPVTPSEHFNTVLYTGTRDNSNSLGATSNAVTGMGFSAELLWIKDRDNQSNNNGSGFSGHWLFDSVQGSGKALNIDGGYYTGSNDFTGNLDGYNGVSSFDSDGFTLDEAEAVNFAYDSYWSGSIDTYERYVAWGWKLGSNGDDETWASGNTDPTTEKYNDAAGVSVIRQEESSSSYPMTGVTVNHSLGAAPEFAFLLDATSNTSDIFAWHKDLDADKYLKLNQTSAQTTGSGYFPSGGSTATTFEIGGDIAGANSMDGYWDIYLYLFSGVEGYSKFGKYTGGSDPFIYTGFKVGFWMVKRIDSSGHWTMFDSARDPHNLVDHQIEPNYNFDESPNSTKGGDFLSNGFKVRSSENEVDAAGGTYIYAAFASSPFKYSNAK